MRRVSIEPKISGGAPYHLLYIDKENGQVTYTAGPNRSTGYYITDIADIDFIEDILLNDISGDEVDRSIYLHSLISSLEPELVYNYNDKEEIKSISLSEDFINEIDIISKTFNIEYKIFPVVKHNKKKKSSSLFRIQQKFDNNSGNFFASNSNKTFTINENFKISNRDRVMDKNHNPTRNHIFVGLVVGFSNGGALDGSGYSSTTLTKLSSNCIDVSVADNTSGRSFNANISEKWQFDN